MFEQTDQQLISKALKGSERAWVKLVRRYEKPLYNYALRMTNNSEQAMDLVQETLISVNRNLATFRGDSAFKSWLFRIANFRCIEFYRRKKPLEDIDQQPEQQAPEQWSPEHVAMQGQQTAEVLSAIDGLPLEQKLVIELKFFQQFTFEQIAEQLGLSSNTVKSRLYNGLTKLKRNFGAEL